MLHLKGPEDSTRQCLDLRSIFNKLAGYKPNIQNPVDFLYTNNKLTEKEIGDGET